MKTISYHLLWKKCIDLKLTKTELAEKTGISRSALAKTWKDETVMSIPFKNNRRGLRVTDERRT